MDDELDPWSIKVTTLSPCFKIFTSKTTYLCHVFLTAKSGIWLTDGD